MGPEGLRHATETAVLAANYMASRLSQAYEILYTGEEGLVAHECIVDLRPMTARTGITVDDVVKRLIDYGFHAPTMSFPVRSEEHTSELQSRAHLVWRRLREKKK